MSEGTLKYLEEQYEENGVFKGKRRWNIPRGFIQATIVLDPEKGRRSVTAVTLVNMLHDKQVSPLEEFDS
jgi:hypothetical protein